MLQGEREMAKDNRTLGRFHLEGIPPAPRGVPQIEVTFDIDANGIVNVTAKDRATGKEQRITITASSGLSDDEIERMVKEAEEHASEDKARRELVEERNKLDTLIYNIEKMLNESGDKLSTEAKEPVEAALKEAKEKLDSEDVAALKAAFETLTQSSHKLAEELYKQTPPSGDAGGDAAASGDDSGSSADKKDDDDVVDAEFEEAH